MEIRSCAAKTGIHIICLLSCSRITAATRYPMKTPVFICLLLLFNLPVHLLAQAPDVEWYRIIGNENGDYPRKIRATADGGYVVVAYREGTITSAGNGIYYIDDYIWVLKFDHAGHIEWENHIKAGSVLMPDIVQTPDGGYAVSLSSWKRECNETPTGLDYYLIKLNSKGEVEWKKNYGGSKNEYAYAIGITPDKGYIIGGHTDSNDGDVSGNHGGRDYWVIKLNATGDLVWQKTLGGSLDEEAFALAVSPDGGCVVTGRTYSNDGNVSGLHGNSDAWLVKLSSTGNLQWQKSLGGSMFEVGMAITHSNNGGYIMASTASSGDGDVHNRHNSLSASSDCWITEVSATGNIIWDKCYGGSFNEQAFGIERTYDGGYVVTGTAESGDGDLSCNKGSEDMWLFKINGTGVMQWQKSFGGNLYEEGHSVAPLADNSYVIAAYTCSQTIAGYHKSAGSVGSCADLMIIKLAPEGAAVHPEVKIDPATAAVCAGRATTLTASVKNAGINTVFQWEKNGTPVGGNSPYYTASDLRENDVVKCTIVPASSCGVAEAPVSDQIIIKTSHNNIQPEINITASSDFLCSCGSIKFQAGVKNAGVLPVFTWKVNEKRQPSGGPVLITSELHPGDVVTCYYTDASICINGGAVMSNTIMIQGGGSTDPSVSISAQNETVCEGSPVKLFAAARNSGTHPAYQWQVNGVNVGTTDSLIISSPSNGDRITCVVTVDPSFPCSSVATTKSNEIVLSVRQRTSTSATIDVASTTICKGDDVEIRATAVNAGTFPSYQWKLNGAEYAENGAVFKSSALSDKDQLLCVVMPGNDVCDAAPVQSNTIVFTVKDAPSVHLTPVDTIAKRGVKVPVQAVVEGKMASFRWNPEAMLVDPSSLQTTTIPLRESIQLNLQVMAQNGCIVEAFSKINIRSALFMPNAFSPNRDGKNDVFRIPEGTSIGLKEFSVFDRWGNKVFSTNNISQVWNGTLNGQPSPAGVYVYFISGTDDKGPVLQKGTVMLVR